MSYTGMVAELPLGPDGLTGSKNLSQVRPTQLLKSHSTTYESGTLQKEGGATKYNSTAITGAPQVLGGCDWWPTAGTQRMVVVTSAGDVLKDSGTGAFGTTLASGLTVSSVIPVFVEGGKEAAANNRKLFLFTGKNAVQVLSADAATMAAITTPPTDWSGSNQPSFGLHHEGSLWGGGNANDPHRLYKSVSTNHETFTGGDSGSYSIYPGEGEGLIGAVSYKRLIIMAKKPTGMYVLDTTDPTSTNWKIYRVTPAIGMISPLAFFIGDDELFWLDQNANVQAASGITEYGDVASRNISQLADMGPFIRENVSLGQLGLVQAIYYSAKREGHFAMAGAGATKNTRRLVLDFNRLDLSRFRWSERDTPVSLWLRKDSNNIPRPMMGDDAGFVWNLDQAARSKDGSGYASEFQIPHMDLGHLDPKLGTVRKAGDFLELVVEPKGNWNLAADIYWDGELQQTVQFNMGTTGSALGSFVLGTDALAGDQVLNKKRRITGSGRRFSVVARNSGAGEDYSVAKFYLHFRPTDERL